MKIKIITLLFIILMIQTNINSQSNSTILYVGDPMCSWCYGISNEIIELKSSLSEDYNFEILVGGLRPGGGDEWNSEFKEFLRKHWEDVGQVSGQEFNFEILNREEFLYDTEPACRSVVVVRDIAPEKLFDWFAAVQKGFYQDNNDPGSLEFYKTLCQNFRIDFNEFSSKFKDLDYFNKTKDEFSKAGNLGVRSFPTVILVIGEQYYRVANGYMKSGEMTEIIKMIESRS